jgi:hypothetical protein
MVDLTHIYLTLSAEKKRQIDDALESIDTAKNEGPLSDRRWLSRLCGRWVIYVN